MPTLARNVVDADYISVLSQWINSLPLTYSSSIFTTQMPGFPGDDSDYELGMKFRASQPGRITGIRYYRPAAESGAHIGRLWTSGGALLAIVNFSGESAAGWQLATLTTPVLIAANTTYVVSVNNNTHYAFLDQGLAAAVTRGPLNSVADGVNGVVNDTPGIFPTSTYHSANYFREVLFTPLTAFEQWKVASSIPIEAAATSDDDRDGIPLLIEYALGLDANSPHRLGLPTATIQTNGALALVHRRLPAAKDIAYTAEVSNDLVNWYSGPGYTTILSIIGNAREEQWTVGSLLTPDASGRQFMRLRVTRP